MSHDSERRSAWVHRTILTLVIALWLSMIDRSRAGDIILFTASTDNTGGANPISVPNNNNPFIPAIDPAVTINPNPALLDGNQVGPLNGITYGPLGALGNTGGTTGFVTSSYTFATSGTYQLIFEVAKTTESPGDSALATDSVQLGGKPLFNFQPGGLGVLPIGLSGEGTFGTSAAIAGLAPSGGEAAFAWIDSTGGEAPIFDTVDGFSASQLFSASFSAKAGSTLSLDAAFLTGDGGPFADYGIIALQSVPEPSSLILLAAGLIGLTAHASRCRARRKATDSPTLAEQIPDSPSAPAT
jgi:PEP-CTERM motif